MATTNPNDTTKAAKAAKVKALRVVARTEGFRRAGFAFGAEARLLAVSALKKEQIEALRKEPELVVTDDEMDAPAEDGGAPT